MACYGFELNGCAFGANVDHLFLLYIKTEKMNWRTQWRKVLDSQRNLVAGERWKILMFRGNWRDLEGPLRVQVDILGEFICMCLDSKTLQISLVWRCCVHFHVRLAFFFLVFISYAIHDPSVTLPVMRAAEKHVSSPLPPPIEVHLDVMNLC